MARASRRRSGCDPSAAARDLARARPVRAFASGSLRRHGLLRGGRTLRRRALTGGGARLSREGLVRSRRVRLALERGFDGAATLRRRRARLASPLPRRVVTRGRLTGAHRRPPRLRRGERHARPPRLRQSDRDRLLRRARAVLALANVIHLLAHELAGRRRRRLARREVLLRLVHRLLGWHGDNVGRPATPASERRLRACAASVEWANAASSRRAGALRSRRARRAPARRRSSGRRAA